MSVLPGDGVVAVDQPGQHPVAGAPVERLQGADDLAHRGQLVGDGGRPGRGGRLLDVAHVFSSSSRTFRTAGASTSRCTRSSSAHASRSLTLAGSDGSRSVACRPYSRAAKTPPSQSTFSAKSRGLM